MENALYFYSDLKYFFPFGNRISAEAEMFGNLYIILIMLFLVIKNLEDIRLIIAPMLLIE